MTSTSPKTRCQTELAHCLTKPSRRLVRSRGDVIGIPSARMVLLRGFDDRGLVFFTNYQSRKAVEAYFSADARHLPLRFDADFLLGKVTAELVHFEMGESL